VTRRFDAPPERVWQLMIDPVARKRIMQVPRIDFEPGRADRSSAPSTTASTAEITRPSSA
jgi:uncharacterized protein YndB with AHSA1/START domain